MGPKICKALGDVQSFGTRVLEWKNRVVIQNPTFLSYGLKWPYIQFLVQLRTDNTFEMLLDNKVLSSGNILEDMNPPLIPPKEIPDPEDKKPEGNVADYNN